MDSTSSNTEIRSEDASKSTEINSPLWNHVSILDKLKGGGGNVRFRCNFCNIEFSGSLHRIRAHLLKVARCGIRVCSKVSNEVLSQLQKEVEETELKAKENQPKPVPFASSTSQTQSSSDSFSSPLGGMAGIGPFRVQGVGPFDSRKRKSSISGPLEKLMNDERVQQLHSEIARMFYSGGLPFHLARNPYYVSSYTYAANNNIIGYLPPGYNMLRTTLLQKERANIERLLLPTKMKWVEHGLSLVSDGWTDPQRRPIINFMATSENGPMFFKGVNCEGEYKDKFFIANLIKEQIKVVGEENVVQVITDNAPVCRAAGLLVESDFPTIYWTPCVVHTLNLALKSICAAKNTESNVETYAECSWISEVANDAFAMRTFITSHSMSNAIYNEFVPLKMLAIAPTRFASVVMMLKRMQAIKHGLALVVISDKWDSFKDDDNEKAGFFKKRVLDDGWWDKIKYIEFTGPIYDMLRFADTDKRCLHLIYDMWDTMIEKVKVVIYQHEKKQHFEDSTFYNVVHEILVYRWNKSNTPLHCIAHSLNPRYYTSDWLKSGVGHVAPHNDLEISNERNKCFRRYFPNGDERRKILIEFAKFSSLREEFGDYDSISDRSHMEASYWWLVHGGAAPMLKSIAIKVLGQPASSSCCERNWSTYSFINSMRRNKITPKRAEDLVFVHTNLRLLSRKTTQYEKGETKMWDVGGDDFESLDGAGILEIANLSLDEPEFESMLFLDGEANDEVFEDVLD